MLEFFVTKGQELKRRDHDVVSADTTDLKASFTLTEDFTGTITVWWRRSDKPGSTWTSTLSGNQCTIPAEALSAATDNVMYGEYDHFVFVSISDTGRTTSAECEIKVNKSSFSTNATPGTGGNPTAYEELVEQFDELKADNQTFKDNMTEQQETFENTVTENVDNIRYVVETETAPPIIEEASGAEITLEDSAYRQVRDLQLYGYSKQVQTTGAQLIKYPYLKSDGFTNNGITYTVSDDGTITANGTATDQSLFCVASESSGWRPSGEVFLSGCPSGGSPATYRIQLYNYNAEDAIAIDNGEGTAIDFTNTDNSWNLCIRIASGYTANNLVFKPMLNAGTSALPWEPYSGGVASPSPDWPQPIHSVADDTNLLDERLFTQTGTAFRFIHIQTDADSVTVSSNTPITSGGSAYIQAIPGNVSSMEGITTRTNGVYAGQSRTISPADGYITIGYFLNGIGNENINFSDYWVMVNAGDTALPYHPYGHNVTVESAGANLINPYAPVSSAGMTDNDDTYSLNRGARNSAVVAYSIEEYKHVLRKYSSLQTRVRISSSVSGQTVYNDVYPDAYSTDVHIDPGASMSEKTSTISIKGDILEAPYANYRIYTTEDGTVTVAKDIMVNAGDTPLPYVPYAAPSSALITLTDSLRGIPVASGGTYTDESGQQWIADYIYRRQTDGKWMVWRNCGAIVYDGSEDEAWSQSSNVSYRFIIRGSTSPALSAAIASNFKVSTKGTTDVGQFVVNDGINSRYFNSNQNSLEAWKSWLAENPQTVVYQRYNPTVEELPDDVQAELNGLYTYNLHTDMWNSDGAYMNLKYVADTKKWINNKIAGLSTAMLNQN